MNFKVKCPECGKLLEVQNLQTQRILTCTCKHTFQIGGTEVEIEMAKPVGLAQSAPPENQSAQAGGVESTTQSPESNMSENELDNYISNLKVQRTEMVQSDPKPPPAPTFKRAEEIEIDEEFIKKSKTSEPQSPTSETASKSHQIINEGEDTLLGQMQSIQETSANEMKNAVTHRVEKRERLKPNETSSSFQKKTTVGAPLHPASSSDVQWKSGIFDKYPTILAYLERFPMLKSPIFQVAAAAVAGALFTTMFFFGHSREDRHEAPDPYLSKLLSHKGVAQSSRRIPEDAAPPEERPERPFGSSTPSVSDKKAKEDANTFKLSQIAKAKDEAKLKKKEEEGSQPIFPESTYEKMLDALFMGDFDKVIQIASAEKEMVRHRERALVLEAKLIHEEISPTDLRRIKSEIDQTRREEPDSASFMRVLAVYQFRAPGPKKNLYNSIELLKSLSLTDATDPLVFAYLGLAYQELGRLDLAERTWEQALELAPKFLWVAEIEEQALQTSRQFRKAQSMAERMTEIKGGELKGYLKLAELSNLQNRPDEAVDFYHKALKIQDSPNIRMALGIQFYSQKANDEAVGEFKWALHLQPTRSQKERAYFYLGKIDCQEKDYESAESSFKQALQIDPKAADVFLEKGKCEIFAGKFSDAIKSTSAASKIKPQSYEIWLNHGLALAKLNKNNDAIVSLKKSISLKETDYGHYLAAVVLLRLKRTQEAAVHAKKAAKLNPQNKEARALAARFR